MISGETSRVASWLYSPGFVRPDSNLHSVSCADLGHETGQMKLHGTEADVEVFGDLSVGPASGHGHEDLFLALREGA